jgi:hypothetical protein
MRQQDGWGDLVVCEPAQLGLAAVLAWFLHCLFASKRVVWFRDYEICALPHFLAAAAAAAVLAGVH